MADYCDILRTRSAQDVITIEVLRFASEEVLEGQLNGRALEQSFSFAQELGGDVASGGQTYSDYMTVQDDYGAIQVSIPSFWDQVDGSPWKIDNEVTGASISAAADLDAFINTYSEPGVFFGVSDDLATLGGYVQLLDAYRDVFGPDCTFEGRYDYQDTAYEGKYDVFSDCAGSGNVMVLLSARPIQNKTAFLLVVTVNIMNDSDLDALDVILDTFDVVGSLP
jgi:serine protease Do